MWAQAGVSEEDQLDVEQAKWVMRRAAWMLRPYRGKVILACLLVVIWTGTVLAGPYLVRYAIDNGLTPRDGGALNLAVFAYIGVAIVAYVVYRTMIVLIGLVGEHFLRDLRVRVFDKLQALPMAFYDREKAGVLVSRMTSDVDSL